MIWATLVFLFLCYSVGIFFITWWYVLAGIASAQLILTLIFLLTQKIKLWKTIRAILIFLPVVITTAAFNWLFLEWEQIAMISARLLLVANMTFIFATVIPILKFARGLSILLYPLKLFRVNPRDVAVTIAVAITFIPVVRVEYNRIRDGMRARGRKRSLKITMSVFMYRILYRSSVLSLTLDAKGYK